MKIEGPPIRILWSLFWRAVVLLPFATLFFGLICVVYFAAFVLPIAAGLYLLTSDWWLAAGCAAAWWPAVLLARWAWRRESPDTQTNEGVLI